MGCVKTSTARAGWYGNLKFASGIATDGIQLLRAGILQLISAGIVSCLYGGFSVVSLGVLEYKMSRNPNVFVPSGGNEKPLRNSLSFFRSSCEIFARDIGAM